MIINLLPKHTSHMKYTESGALDWKYDLSNAFTTDHNVFDLKVSNGLIVSDDGLGIDYNTLGTSTSIGTFTETGDTVVIDGEEYSLYNCSIQDGDFGHLLIFNITNLNHALYKVDIPDVVEHNAHEIEMFFNDGSAVDVDDSKYYIVVSNRSENDAVIKVAGDNVSKRMITANTRQPLIGLKGVSIDNNTKFWIASGNCGPLTSSVGVNIP